MLELLREKFEDVYRYISRTGKIRTENINEAVRKIKLALLEADVHYKVVKEFIENIKEKAIGEKVLKSITPSQQFIKIVYDEIISLLGEKSKIFPDNFPINKLNIIVLIGLNGSGKTTTAIKLSKRYKKSNPLIIAADPYRPAAIDQLVSMGKKYDVPIFYNKNEDKPLKIINSGLKYCKENNYNLAIIDTAGRMELNNDLMKELTEISDKVKSDFTIFVADALTGQNLINVAKEFQKVIDIDGVILTKFDSDARGGAAISLKYITDLDIFFIGTGENVNDIEKFIPDKIARRILGMTDIISIVQQAQEISREQEAVRLEEKIKKQEFDFNDFLKQLRTIHRSGSFKKIIEMLPVKLPVAATIDENRFKHIEAIILSMTPAERENVDLIDLSRKLRIAKGSGRPLSEVTQLINQFKNMKKMLKTVLKKGINYRLATADIGSLLNFLR